MSDVRKIEIKMIFTKSTKRTHVYSSANPIAAVTTVYINKDELPTPTPASLTVFIEHEQ